MAVLPRCTTALLWSVCVCARIVQGQHLYAFFTTYPDYSGGLSVAGSITLTKSTDTSQVLTWDLTGLDPLCVSGAAAGVPNGCGIHVHTGKSCAVAADVGGHYYSSSLSSDPWASIVYVADSDGQSTDYASVTTGLTLTQLAGKAFVVHELTTGGRIACGLLTSAEAIFATSFEPYPGYTGTFQSVLGTVTIIGSTPQILTWDLAGLDTECVSGAAATETNGCGIHVHTGTSCAVAADVGGHYYGSSLLSDPWADIVYVAASSGMSKGSTTITTSLTLAEMTGRAFVVHQLDSGTRIACALMHAPTEVSTANFVVYPGYAGSYPDVTGQMSLVSSTGTNTSQTMSWSLSNLDIKCTSGAGDDIPNGCGIHVHSGRDCAVAANVGGHYYGSSLSSDPWADIVYVADSSGISSGSSTVSTGLTISHLIGRAFVVHELESGTRIACGVLEAPMTTLGASPSPAAAPAPAPAPAPSPGTIQVSSAAGLQLALVVGALTFCVASASLF